MNNLFSKEGTEDPYYKLLEDKTTADTERRNHIGVTIDVDQWLETIKSWEEKNKPKLKQNEKMLIIKWFVENKDNADNKDQHTFSLVTIKNLAKPEDLSEPEKKAFASQQTTLLQRVDQIEKGNVPELLSKIALTSNESKKDDSTLTTEDLLKIILKSYNENNTTKRETRLTETEAKTQELKDILSRYTNLQTQLAKYERCLIEIRTEASKDSKEAELQEIQKSILKSLKTIEDKDDDSVLTQILTRYIKLEAKCFKHNNDLPTQLEKFDQKRITGMNTIKTIFEEHLSPNHEDDKDAINAAEKAIKIISDRQRFQVTQQNDRRKNSKKQLDNKLENFKNAYKSYNNDIKSAENTAERLNQNQESQYEVIDNKLYTLNPKTKETVLTAPISKIEQLKQLCKNRPKNMQDIPENAEISWTTIDQDLRYAYIVFKDETTYPIILDMVDDKILGSSLFHSIDPNKKNILMWQWDKESSPAGSSTNDHLDTPVSRVSHFSLYSKNNHTELKKDIPCENWLKILGNGNYILSRWEDKCEIHDLSTGECKKTIQNPVSISKIDDNTDAMQWEYDYKIKNDDGGVYYIKEINNEIEVLYTQNNIWEQGSDVVWVWIYENDINDSEIFTAESQKINQDNTTVTNKIYDSLKKQPILQTDANTDIRYKYIDTENDSFNTDNKKDAIVLIKTSETKDWDEKNEKDLINVKYYLYSYVSGNTIEINESTMEMINKSKIYFLPQKGFYCDNGDSILNIDMEQKETKRLNIPDKTSIEDIYQEYFLLKKKILGKENYALRDPQNDQIMTARTKEYQYTEVENEMNIILFDAYSQSDEKEHKVQPKKNKSRIVSRTGEVTPYAGWKISKRD